MLNLAYPKEAHMQTSPEQVLFLQLQARALRARRIIDVGCFTGYSACALALALTDEPDARVVWSTRSIPKAACTSGRKCAMCRLHTHGFLSNPRVFLVELFLMLTGWSFRKDRFENWACNKLSWYAYALLPMLCSAIFTCLQPEYLIWLTSLQSSRWLIFSYLLCLFFFILFRI